MAAENLCRGPPSSALPQFAVSSNHMLTATQKDTTGVSLLLLCHSLNPSSSLSWLSRLSSTLEQGTTAASLPSLARPSVRRKQQRKQHQGKQKREAAVACSIFLLSMRATEHRHM